MELTMKKYIGINIVLFILWSIILGWGYLVVMAMGATGEIYAVYLIISLIVIFTLKIKLNYKIIKKKISIFLLIFFCCFSIFLGSVLNSLEYLIIAPLFLQTFINLIFIKELRKKAIINFIIFNLMITIIIFINYKMKLNKITYELSSIINVYLIIILTIPLFYQKILEYKYVRYIIENIDIKNKINNLSRYIFINIFSFLLFIVSNDLFIFLYRVYKKEIFVFVIISVLIVNVLKLLLIKKILIKNRFILLIFQFLLLIFFIAIPIIYSKQKIHYTGRYEFMYFEYIYLSLFLYSVFLKKAIIISIINFIIFNLLFLKVFIGSNSDLDMKMFMITILIVQKIIEYNAVREIEAKDIY